MIQVLALIEEGKNNKALRRLFKSWKGIKRCV